MYHSIKTPSFGIGDRPSLGQRYKTPGPGTYRPPSDFGYVDHLKVRGDRNKMIQQTYDGS